MNPHQIKAEINMAGSSQTDIANLFDVTDTTITRVIYGDSRSDRVAKHIAELIKKPLHKVWPKWYQKTGRAAA